jgi:hypothetical protein
MDVPIDDILSAIQGPSLQQSLIEGAAIPGWMDLHHTTWRGTRPSSCGTSDATLGVLPALSGPGQAGTRRGGISPPDRVAKHAGRSNYRNQAIAPTSPTSRSGVIIVIAMFQQLTATKLSP